MPGQFIVLRVMVASPSDVDAERNVLPQIIDEVNRDTAEPAGIHLKLLRWEADAFPGFHQEGPQGLIDSALKISDCDLLIGIFWKRFGTPISDGATGTEHEFTVAYESWKRSGYPHIMMYFNHKPYSPKSPEEMDQWTKVLGFKESFPKEGLWWRYNGRADFVRQVRSHLQRFVTKQTALLQAANQPTEAPAELEALRQSAIAATQRVISTERAAYPKYMRDVYATRADAEQRFQAFLDGRSFAYVVVGRSGMGKTCLLYNFAESLEHPESTSDRIPLLVDLRHVDFSKDSLEQFLSRQLRANDSIDGPATVLADHNATLVIFVDAINELVGKDNLTDFNRQLCQLRLKIDRNGYRIRFCISCRTQSWQYFESQPWAEHRAHVELNGYDRNDLGRIIKLYFDRFKIDGTLKGEAREQCADPLILRFLCLAYTRDPERNAIGEVTSLRRKDIFEKYAAATREEIGRAIGSDEALHERTTRYILHIASKMLAQRRAYITLEEVKEVADAINHPDKQFEPRQLASDSHSYFSKLVDLIFESERDGYRFIFEAYFEFSLGRYIAEVRWPGFTGEDRVKRIGDDLTHLMRRHAHLTADSNFPNLFDSIHYAVLGTECDWDTVTGGSAHQARAGGYNNPDIFLELLQRLLQSYQPGLRGPDPTLPAASSLQEGQAEGPSLQFDWIQQGCSIIRDSKLVRARTDLNGDGAAGWQRTFSSVLALLDDLTLVTDFVISWDLQDTLEDLAKADFQGTLAEVEKWFTSPSTLKKMFAAQALARLGSGEQLNEIQKNEVVRVLLDLLDSRDLRANFWLTRPITFAVGELAMRPEFRREWTGSRKSRLNQLIGELAELPGESRNVSHIRGVALPLLALLSEGERERLSSLSALIESGSRWELWNLAFEFQKWPDLWTNNPGGWLWVWTVLARLANTGDAHLRYAVLATRDSLLRRTKKWDKEYFPVIETVERNLRDSSRRLGAARMPEWQKGADTGPSDWRGLDRIGVVYSPAYLEPANDNHLECRERVQAIIDTLEETAAGRFKWVTPRHATEKDLTKAHSKHSDRHRNGFPWDGYVETVREESRSSRFHTGPRERRSESFEIATLAAGGVLEAVDYLRKGDARAAFALTRPPGHLANNSICIFNNIAVGALYASEWYRRILIVDCDAHHGQHTQRVFYSNPDVLYFSTHIDNDYTRESGTVDHIGEGAGEGYNFNVPYPAGMDDHGYKYIIDRLLVPMAQEFAPEMIFVSAGFDGHFDDYLTPDCVLTDEAYIYLAERLRDLAVERKIGIVGALEGGYGLDGMANSLVGMLGVWGDWDGVRDGKMRRTPLPADLPKRYQSGAFEEVKRTVQKRIERMKRVKEKSGDQYPLFADDAYWEQFLRSAT
jgi:acetoin utilization deacetylase AcuC-like enzyme